MQERMDQRNDINKIVWLLICISFLIRAAVAGLIELGNDEVYYRLYAVFPDMSHFDHPPMVGWVIQLFTLNLSIDNEFFLRLGAVVLGSVNTWIIFIIGKEIKDEITGLYAALLYTASIYCSIIAGIFILPDAPQIFFWLLTLLFLLRSLPDREFTISGRKNILLAGLTTGLALLSKYHSVFLITGAAIYLIFFNRGWFRKKELYFSLLIAIILFLPVIIWNYKNDFISFTFHEERIDDQNAIRWDFLGTELAGQFFYNNPVNVVLIFLSLMALIRRNKFINRDPAALLLSVSLPLSAVFLSFSIGNRTLPHWTGPAYLGYMLIAASWLSGLHNEGKTKHLVPAALKISVAFILVILILGVLQIRLGIFPVKNDPGIQLYGYRQLGEKFEMKARAAEEEGDIHENAPVIATRWFPAANFDYYLPHSHKVYAVGSLERIHKYYWINKERGMLKRHSDAWYVGFSDDLPGPAPELRAMYDSVVCRDTIFITRCDKVVREAYLFRMYGLK